MSYGANPQDWQRFLDQGLEADLLPVVSDPGVPIHKQSRLPEDNRGKVPSRVAPDGTLVGMPGWSRDRHTAADVRRWMKDDRLGVCIQTREVRAVDVDTADPTISADVRETVEMMLGALPCRSRPNSGKLLLAFRLPGTYLKRIIETPHGRIEFLANGQHFVAAGTHPSGVRYEWNDTALPWVDLQDFEQMWAALEAQYGKPTETRDRTATHSGEVLGLTDAEIRAALSVLDPDMPYDQWCKTGMALHYETRGEGLSYWQEWSANGAEYPGDEELGYKWQSFGRYTGPPVTAGTLVQMAAERGVYVGPAAPAAATEFDDLTVNADGTPKPLRFQFQPLGELLTARPLGWIVKGLLPKAQLGVIYGASGSGKSFVALDLAMSIARGEPWRGRRVTRMPVAYVIAEGSAGFKKRVEAYAMRHGVKPAEVPIHGLAAAPNLGEPNDVKELIKGLQAIGGVGLVVIDTLAQVTPGADENTGKDMNPIMKRCQAISAATGALVLLVHHSGKDAARGARGWTGIRAALDVEIEVVRQVNGRFVRLTKSKDDVDGLEWGFDLDIVPVGIDEDGDEITSCVVREAEVPKAVMSDRKLGAREKVVMAAFQTIAEAQTQGIEVEAVVEEALGTMEVEPEKRSKVKANLRATLRNLLKTADSGIGEAEDGTLYVC